MSSGPVNAEIIAPITTALRDRRDLTVDQVRAFMTELMAGRLETSAVVEVLELLRAKGETALEITEAARVMRDNAFRMTIPKAPVLLDTCGTGGDGSCTVNVSSLVALIAATAGIPVAKHGNRAVSGTCGSADFLSAIGIPLEVSPDKLLKGLNETNFAFFYAPTSNPSMKHAAQARKSITGRTMFNCLGPLANPARATHQLVGVYEPRLVELVVKALADLGSKHAIVVHANDGLDEVSPVGPTKVAEWSNGSINIYEFTPEEVGIPRAPVGSLRSDGAEAAVREGLAIIEGAQGPKTDLVLLNAGFALKAADRVKTPAEGVALARTLLADGSVRRKVDAIRAFYAKN